MHIHLLALCLRCTVNANNIPVDSADIVSDPNEAQKIINEGPTSTYSFSPPIINNESRIQDVEEEQSVPLRYDSRVPTPAAPYVEYLF